MTETRPLLALATRLLLLVGLFTALAHSQATTQTLVAGLLNFLNSNDRALQDEPNDTPVLPLDKYDFIIVGAGSAGCVVANRLTEVPEWKVLLIEAGGPENSLMDIPLVASFLQFTGANWNYMSEPSNYSCLGLNGGRCPIPRGKVMGGSSVLNFMVYTRGDARDYNNWEALGNDGWGWKDVFPYFLKSEDILIKDSSIDPRVHSKGGYQTVDSAPYRTQLVKAFVKAGGELGYKIRDYNNGNIEGFSFVQSTIKDGVRMGTSRAFLHPIKKRRNLTVVKMALVSKILFKDGRAIGVQYIKDNRKFTVYATKEVISSAGAINTPQLLMLSGIGPAAHLKQMKIPVVANLPVGYNLQDHPVIGYVAYLVKGKPGIDEESVTGMDTISDYMLRHRGPLTITGGLEGLAFIDVFNSPKNQDFPNLEIQLCSASPLTFPHLHAVFGTQKSIYESTYRQNKRQSYLMFMNIMRPKSRGRVWLKSTDPKVKPAIDIGFFKHPDDVKILVEGVKIAQNLSRTSAYAPYKPVLYDKPIPPCARHKRGSDAYWECHARHLSITNYHQCGTAKMGPDGDPSSVVDPRLRVRGVKGLRVIDASIFPVIMSAHTNAPTIMVAEKASDMIKEDWSVGQNNVKRRRRV